MLITNLEIFNAVLTRSENMANPSYVYYSGADFYDLLGRGEKIVVQIVVDSAILPGGTDTSKVMVAMERSNDGKVWDRPDGATLEMTFSSGSTLPNTAFFDTGNVPYMTGTGTAFMFSRVLSLGAKVRFVAWSGMVTTSMRLIASVRGEQGR